MQLLLDLEQENVTRDELAQIDVAALLPDNPTDEHYEAIEKITGFLRTGEINEPLQDSEAYRAYFNSRGARPPGGDTG